jgi:hypothetical protein
VLFICENQCWRNWSLSFCLIVVLSKNLSIGTWSFHIQLKPQSSMIDFLYDIHLNFVVLFSCNFSISLYMIEDKISDYWITCCSKIIPVFVLPLFPKAASLIPHTPWVLNSLVSTLCLFFVPIRSIKWPPACEIAWHGTILSNKELIFIQFLQMIIVWPLIVIENIRLATLNLFYCSINNRIKT